MKARTTLFALLLVGFSTNASAEELCPKYGECVSAEHFQCHDIERSSLVTRVCYSEANSYMIVGLKGVNYQYCSIDPNTVREFLGAESMGRFFNQRIKGSGSDGPFDCRTHPVPSF